MSSLLHPGPPPSTPPPPIPVSSPSLRVSTRTPIVKQSRDIPRSRPQRFRGPQWPARPQSQEITDAVIWPVKAPRKPPARPPPATPVPAPAPAPAPAAPAPAPAPASARRSTISRPSTDARRPSLSSLSLNRFSLHRSRTKQDDIPPPLPKHARRPSSSSVDSIVVDAKSDITTGNTTGLRTVQRQQSGLQPRSSSPNPDDTVASLHAPQAPTLQKKRSFFRRVADRLTRSRTSLRDDYKSRRSSIQSDAVIHEVPPVPRRSATLPNKTLTADSPRETPLPPTPTSNRKGRRRPSSIKLYASEAAEGSSHPLPSPSAVPLPPSPLTPSLSPHPSLRQPLSPAPSIKQSLSPILSLRIPPSPTASMRQPTSPAASTTWQPPSPGKSRHPSPAPHSNPTSPRQSNYAESTGHPTPASPRQPPPFPAPVAARSPVQSPSALYFPLPPLSPPPVKRRDTRAAHHSRTERDSRDDDRERERDSSRDVSVRPGGHYLPDTAEGNEAEEEDDEEEERKASEMKVNRWLASPESPTTSSSLDHSLTLSYSHSQSSHSHSGGVTTKRFEGGSAFGGIDEEDAGVGLEMWRGAMMKEDGGEDVLPEVERMALEAEERAHAMGRGVKKGDAKSLSQGKMGRQLSLFGRRRGKDDNVKAPTLRPRAATFGDPVTASKRRSFSFLSSTSPTSLPLPPSPAFPVSPVSDGLPVPAARPRPRRQGVSPTMHTRGSILLETNDIQDPEVRRLSEMVFLT